MHVPVVQSNKFILVEVERILILIVSRGTAVIR